MFQGRILLFRGMSCDVLTLRIWCVQATLQGVHRRGQRGAVSGKIEGGSAEKLWGFGSVSAREYPLSVEESRGRNSVCLSSTERPVFWDADDARVQHGVFFRCRASGKQWTKDT